MIYSLDSLGTMNGESLIRVPPMTRRAPTPAQIELWAFIVKTIKEKGYQPSQAEMAKEFGISTPSIQDRLRGLEARGYIKLTGVERAIQMPDLIFVPEKRKR